MSLLNIEKHPLQEKLESKTLDWFPYESKSPFTTQLVNHKTGEMIDINHKKLLSDNDYFKSIVV